MAEEINNTGYPQPAAVELDDATREMIEAGVFYGKRKSKTHPRMKASILANRGGVEIFNLTKTSDELARALKFLKERVVKGELVLFVGTQPAAQDSIRTLADSFQMPFVVNRWVGGALTNFKVVSKRVEYMKKIRAGLSSHAFDKYTKKERLGIERELERLNELMGGFENMPHVPAVLMAIDPLVHMTAIREARTLNIPIIAFADTDADPNLLTYAVPGNTKSKKSIDWFLSKVKDAFEEGRREVQSVPKVESSDLEPASEE
ncbi:MAG: 30S ribosomal protein S2 [Patescibacteria group bacterium]|nr:30S ribosomal protein S2 [Patescibacteria group bacterium]